MAVNPERIKEILSQYKSEWLKPDYEGAKCPRIPATALLGNGDVGAFSVSDYGKAAFSFSKSNFWEYKGPALAIGTLSAEIVDGGKNGFYECQDILSARVITETGALHAESFIASENNYFVMKLRSDADIRIRLKIEAFRSERRPCSSALSGDKISVAKQTVFHGSHTLAAVISADILGSKAENMFCCDGAASMEFNLYEGSEVFIIAAVCCGRPAKADPYNRALFMLDKIKTFSNIDTIENEHALHWQEYWNESCIDLDTSDEKIALIQKYYYGAQYLLGSGINENADAPGLYGIWHADDNPPWNSDYHLNYNFISAFYGCASSNRPYQLKSACVAVNDYVERGVKNAGDINEWRKFEPYFIDKLIAEGKISEREGIPGTVLYPVGIAPYGTSDMNYWNETMNAAYSAFPIAEYCRSMSDESFRRQIFYPYLKLVLALLDSWLVEENGQYTLYAGYNEGSWAKNPAVELAAYKLCLREAIFAAEENGVDEDLIEKWENYLKKLAPQPTTVILGKKVLALAEEEYEDGAFRPMEEAVPEDGNAIALDCVLPGNIIGYFSPEEDINLLKNTVELFDIRSAWDCINNFPRLFDCAVNAGYDIESVIDAFARVLGGSLRDNLTVDDEVHGFEKAGAVRAVNDMLVLSNKGIIKLFPNWRKDLDASFENLRTYGAFLVSARYSAKEQKIVSAEMVSLSGGRARVAVEENMKILDSSGNEVQVTVKSPRGRSDVEFYEFESVAGEKYTLI